MSDPLVIAFTGTRNGLTPPQRAALRDVLAGYPGAVLHNGCAEGADAECLALVAEEPVGRGVVLHPAKMPRFLWAQAWVVGWWPWEIRPLSEPLERNHRMVAASSLLIACPDGPERLRSGTWSTVREARRMGRGVVLCWPDGRVER